jgi:hypothetical protein
VKRILSAALLVLVPVTARAEYGTQASRWNESSPRQEAQQPAAPAPEKTAADAPVAPAPAETVVKGDEKQEEKVSAGSAVLTPEQLAKLQGFFFSASMDQYMGLGTFVNPNLYASLGTWVNAFISYRKIVAGKNFALSVQPFGAQGLTYEYTMPDNATGRRIVNDDARLALSMPALYKNQATGIILSPNLTVIVPTTPESWHAGMITRVGAGGAAQRLFALPVGQLQATLSGFATYGIYTQTANVVRANDRRDAQGNNVVLARGGEQIADIAANNSAINLRWGVGATWLASDWLFFSASYGMIANWKYAAVGNVDEFTPKGTDVNGNGVAWTGMSASQLQFGSVSVAVNITDVLSASLYLYNLAPLLDTQSKNIRFPFADVTGIANNYTILGLSLAATF